MAKNRRRLTPTESDALVAHIPPMERVLLLTAMIAKLRAAGITVEYLTDATGRTYIKLDHDQIRATLGDEVADLFREGAETSPLPIWRKTPAA